MRPAWRITRRAVEPDEDPTEDLDLVFRNLRSSARGLNGRAAARRLILYGPNQLARRGKPQWPRQLLEQFSQPLALLRFVSVAAAFLPLGLAAGLSTAPFGIRGRALPVRGFRGRVLSAFCVVPGISVTVCRVLGRPPERGRPGPEPPRVRRSARSH